MQMPCGPPYASAAQISAAWLISGRPSSAGSTGSDAATSPPGCGRCPARQLIFHLRLSSCQNISPRKRLRSGADALTCSLPATAESCCPATSTSLPGSRVTERCPARGWPMRRPGLCRPPAGRPKSPSRAGLVPPERRLDGAGPPPLHVCLATRVPWRRWTPYRQRRGMGDGDIAAPRLITPWVPPGCSGVTTAAVPTRASASGADAGCPLRVRFLLTADGWLAVPHPEGPRGRRAKWRCGGGPGAVRNRAVRDWAVRDHGREPGGPESAVLVQPGVPP